MNFHIKNNNPVKKGNAEKWNKKCHNDANNSEETCVPNNETSSCKSDRIRNRLDQAISNESKKKILNLLDEVGQLSDLEKLFLYVQLPTGTTPNIDITKQRYLNNPLGKKGDVEVAQTYTWIQSHLEEDPDVSLPKHEVYEEYRNYFEENKLDPLCAADFGKVMKHVFPSVKPRRLGTRGNSRYCYSGLKKKVNIKPPSLQDFKIGEDIYDDSHKTELNEINDAACHIIFEWAEKLLSKKFYSIKELAKHLVENFYIGKPSVTALSLLSVPSAKNVDEGNLSKKRKQNQLQYQKKFQECNKEQKKRNKLQCINDTSLKVGMTENGIHSNMQLSDTQNVMPVEPVNNSQASSIMPLTSQALLTLSEQISNSLNGSKMSHLPADNVKNKDYGIVNEKDIQKCQRSKSLEFKKLDYEIAIYNLFNQTDILGNESSSLCEKEHFVDSRQPVEVNMKKPRIDEFSSNSIASESSPIKINSLDACGQSENSSFQNTTNPTSENKATDSSQLRMLLEKDFPMPVNQLKLFEVNKNVVPITDQANTKNTPNFLVNKAEMLRFPFSNTDEQWKKDNFHSTKLSLIAETYNRSLKQSAGIQELNNDRIQSNLVFSLSNNNSALENCMSDTNQLNSDMSGERSFNFTSVPVKQDDECNFNVSDELQTHENFSSIAPNNPKTSIITLQDSHKDVYQNYDAPNSPFLFPQQASMLANRPRHHSSHNIGQNRNYNRYPFGSRSRHFSGPTYSKRDKSLETYNFGSDPTLGNRTSRFRASFSPPVRALNLNQNIACFQEMQAKISESFAEVSSQEMSIENADSLSQLNNAENMENNINLNATLLVSDQAFKNELTDDFSQNMQHFHPIEHSENRCQSVPPHKMLQMLIDQNSPIHSPVISKSYPTTPVVNQIFHFPVSQSYQHDSNLSQMEPSKLLSQNTQQNMTDVLLGEWQPSDGRCRTSMTELLEQPLDDLQTTLDDLKDCDEFSKFA